ncbi:MAG: DNA primase [Clostridiales bacterium]|nr:DNA primase [Clostridiales bacterium]
MFPESFLQEVMDKNDVVDTISRYVQLKRSGTSMKGLCPFHREKTPSFHVSADKQFYHCFGCGKGGNVISFVMQMENLDFIEAVKLLAEQAGLTMPEPSGRTDSGAAERRRLIYKINTGSARFFYDCLLSERGEAARRYITDRRLTQNTVNKFGLGFAPEGSRLLARLRELGFSDDEILLSGMAVKNDSGSIYDRFRNRLMFPIIDVRKNIIGFGGRVMDDSVPKYLNSPETAAFSKSYNLFGLNFAKSAKDSFFVLVEGYMDVISLHQSGITSAVATLGTALTPEQARIIKRMRQEAVIAYDSDEAGQNATKRAIELLADEDVTVKVLTMNDCKDPDEYIKANGAGAFHELINNAKLQIEYKISKLQEKYNISVTDEKVKYVSELAAEFAKIKSPVEREIYVGKTARETGVSADGIFSEIDRLNAASERKNRFDHASRGLRGNPSVGRLSGENPERENALRAEKTLLNLICFDPQVFQMTAASLSSGDFEEGAHRELYERLSAVRNSGAEPDARLIVAQMSGSEAAAGILIQELNIEDNVLAARELIRRLTAYRKKQKLLETVTSGDLSQSQKLDEMREYLRKEVGTNEQHEQHEQSEQYGE